MVAAKFQLTRSLERETRVWQQQLRLVRRLRGWRRNRWTYNDWKEHSLPSNVGENHNEMRITADPELGHELVLIRLNESR